MNKPTCRTGTNQGVKAVDDVGRGFLLPNIIAVFVRLLDRVNFEAALQIWHVSLDILSGDPDEDSHLCNRYTIEKQFDYTDDQAI